MTHRLSRELAPLLNPQRLITAADVLADRFLIPDAAGIYGWWFQGELPGVPLEGTLQYGLYRLLYVGIAPKGFTSKSTLRKRICRNHLGRRIASSTLRRSLASLLKTELQLAICLNLAGKQTMAPADEANLTGWMRDHAALSVLLTDRPWEIERQLIAGGDPSLPLNILGTTHEFRKQMMRLRLTTNIPDRIVAIGRRRKSPLRRS